MNLSKVLVAALVALAIVATAATATVMGLLLSGSSEQWIYSGGISSGVSPQMKPYGLALPSGAQAYIPENSIVTSATGTVYLTPSEVMIYLSIETPEPYKNATQAYGDVVSRASNLINKLKALSGVKYVQTISMRLTPQYEWSGGSRVFKGYVASYVLAVKADTEAAGKVIAEAVKAGTDVVRGVTFTVPEDELVKAKEEALKLAISRAYEKARKVAEELNVSIGKIVYVMTEYSTPEYVRTYAKLEYTVLAGQLPEVPIEVGRGYPMTATVTAAFEIIQG